jgi:hypothetical protein
VKPPSRAEKKEQVMEQWFETGRGTRFAFRWLFDAADFRVFRQEGALRSTLNRHTAMPDEICRAPSIGTHAGT